MVRAGSCSSLTATQGGDGYGAVLTGLAAGEPVVGDGNFLIDAESNLRAGTQALGHAHGDGDSGGPAAAAAAPAASNDKATTPSPTHDAHDAAAHEGHDAPVPDTAPPDAPAPDEHAAHQNP